MAIVSRERPKARFKSRRFCSSDMAFIGAEGDEHISFTDIVLISQRFLS